MLAPRLRRALTFLRRTPLHPQWLLGRPHAAEELLRSHAQGVVLDVGCSDRWVQKALSDECRYVGIDYPTTGRDLYRSSPDIFCDAAKLPISDGSIDTVTILDVLEHIAEPQKALAEMGRVLKPGGRLILTMPFLYPIHDEPHDYQRYTSAGLAREIRAAGLRMESISPSRGSAETAGLVCCLALAGMALQAIRSRRFGMFAVPLALAAIPVTNLLAASFSALLPSWGSVTSGYMVVASKT